LTRVFDELGSDYPITILKAGPCSIIQVKSLDQGDDCDSVQIGFEDKVDRHLNKPEKGHFDKSGAKAKRVLKEFHVDNLDGLEAGQDFGVDVFEMGDLVTVSGLSKGKGFAGHMKRHGFSGGRRSHGKNSVMRKAGSIGTGSDPSRVWPGTRMAGRMGNENVTVKNLEVTRVEKDKNLVFIKGAVPGAKNGIVFISKI
jgi:large subunit ribosomal protein L3